MVKEKNFSGEQGEDTVPREEIKRVERTTRHHEREGPNRKGCDLGPMQSLREERAEVHERNSLE